MEGWLDWFRLLRSPRVGPSTFFRLMAEHGSAKAALAALPEVARKAGAGSYTPCAHETAEAEWERGRLAGATPIGFGGRDYPDNLAGIPDPPPFLWTIGDLGLLRRDRIALVGARNASSLGLRTARSLARDIGAAGYATVSGFARGIDTAVHETSLGTGTIAVMAGGVDVVYPAENAVLAQDMAERGLRISEQPVGLAPQARHFPRRNRLISGLAGAVVVVEAAAKSGSLITARVALEQGRDVLAVPGHPFDARAAGCNLLIRDGAVLVRGARDVLEAVAASPSAARVPARRPPAAEAEAEATARGDHAEPLAAAILDRLGPSPTPEDQLIRDVGRPPPDVAQALVLLELDGRVLRQPGGLLSRVEG